MKQILYTCITQITLAASSMSYDVIDIPSQNFNSRAGASPQMIIAHCIGLSLEETVNGFAFKDSEKGGLGASPHYFIPQITAYQFVQKFSEQFSLSPDLKFPDKIPAIQFVAEESRAWHAGVSSWSSINNLNSESVGIEFHAPGYGNQGQDWYYFTPFTEPQIETGAALMLDICARQVIDRQQIWGHSDIAPLRKTDPGPLFPWKLLYEKYQLGLWPNYDSEISLADISIMEIKKKLIAIGYNMSTDDQWTDLDRHVINAFRMHFMQGAYYSPSDPRFGEADQDVIKVLFALSK